jgi:hypothetical protein
MNIDLRLPDIKGNDREQLRQIRSYLYQLIPQLQFALQNAGSAGSAESYVVSTPNNVSSAPSTSSSFNAEVAFVELKPLIIKSAEIVQAYYDEISSMLSGEYVAKSDFGTFTEQMEQKITQSSTEVEQAFKDIQQIFSDIDNISFTIAEANAHLRSGLLYYDENGVPVYGLEIGQRNTVDGEEVFNKYARFTSDRLSFYDQNGAEVAYISDYKLYIRSLEITTSYKVGGLLSSVMANGDVVKRWVGGDG